MREPELHAGNVTCPCVADHNPEPDDVEVHHVWPLGTGGPDTPENRVPVCPTTHTNSHRLEREWYRHKGEPPWDIRRRFGYFTRELARRAYQSAMAGRLVD